MKELDRFRAEIPNLPVDVSDQLRDGVQAFLFGWLARRREDAPSLEGLLDEIDALPCLLTVFLGRRLREINAPKPKLELIRGGKTRPPPHSA